MIIGSPRRSLLGSDALISATVESQRKGQPAELWFRFPSLSDPSVDADPFAVALLLLAMQNGEPLEIAGSISRKLFSGLQEYQNRYHSWFPDRFKIIEIRPESLREDPPSQDPIAACAFSGGVDSFYTFLSRREAGTSVASTLFMAGFDMPLQLTDSIGELTRSYSAMMRGLGVEFVSGSTNVRAFVNSVDWTNSHGQALVASALFFRRRWRRFFIPASYTSSSYPQWGTHPALDPLLSTEATEFVHHGEEANRVRKLELISHYPESFERLRVCWIQDIGLKNCGECEKCIRTMIALDILGKLGNYRTFASSLTGAKVRALTMRTHQARLFARELIREAMKRRRLSTCLDLSYALLRREIFYRTLSLRK